MGRTFALGVLPMYPARARRARPASPRERTVRLPDIRLELVADQSPAQESGFLRLQRKRYRALYPDGSASEEFTYDSVDRRALDAVVIAAHFADADGRRHVFVRSSVRPPVAERTKDRSPVPELDPPHGVLWELPAGLVEAHERGLDGVRESARRELLEELGFSVPVETLAPLGPSVFPAAGVIGERLFFYSVEVRPEEQVAPTLDGSPLEHFGAVVAIPLADALAHCQSGAFADVKTEIGIRRLVELLAGAARE
jgi:ADP-ribose pyrophosphatase